MVRNNYFLPGMGPSWVKIRGDQGWKYAEGNIFGRTHWRTHIVGYLVRSLEAGHALTSDGAAHGVHRRPNRESLTTV